jgi:acetolactate synthase small subunit
MNWLYLVRADDRPRIQSRVMQIFDHQRISILSFASMKLGEQISMRICGDIGLCDGQRIAALILHLEDVRGIRAFPAEDATAQTVTLFSVACERSGQAALLDTLAAVGATVILVNPSHIDFEAVGSEMEMAELYETLQCYWEIDKRLVTSGQPPNSRRPMPE